MNIIIDNRYFDNITIDYESIINEVIQKTLIYENFNYDYEISISIVDNNEIKTINSKFRSMDKPTDVLSFPLLDINEIIDTNEQVELGDIIISWDKVLSQSNEYGHTIKRELAFLIAHSVLHILGYNHLTEDEYEIMISKQNDILNILKITR